MLLVWRTNITSPVWVNFPTCFDGQIEFGITHTDMNTQERNHYLGSEKYTWYEVIFSKARLNLSSLNEEGALRFQNNVIVTVEACLLTQKDGLVRLMLATLAADITVTLRYIKAININLSNQCCELTS